MNKKGIKKISELFKSYGLVVAITIIFLCTGIYYVRQSVRDVLFMDYWRMSTQLIPKVMENELTFSDIWLGEYGQRNPLMRLLLAMSIKFMNLNCIWESFAGIIMIVCSVGILYFVWNRICKDDESKIKKQILFIPIIAFLFNLNQWEILSSQFSFVFMLRLAAYMLMFWFLDNELHKEDRNWCQFVKLGIATGIIICLMSQLYFCAMLLAICFAFAFDFFLGYGTKKSKIREYGAFLIPTCCFVLLYFVGANFSSGGGNMGIFLGSLFDGSFFKGILYMLAGSIVPQSILQQMKLSYILLLGGIFVIIILYAVWLYFRKNLYKKSFFPLLVTAYGLLNIPIIIYGRLGEFDLFYMTSSRYVCETKFIWVGCILIFAHEMLYAKQKIKTYLLPGFGIVVLFLSVIYANKVELKIAPYRGGYKDSLIQVLQKPEIQMKDEELALLQAPVEVVKDGIRLLKSYQLNVYASEVEIGTDLGTAVYKNEIFEDGWVGINGSLTVRTTDFGKIHIETYDPYAQTHPEGVCKVYVNEELSCTIPARELNAFEIQAEQNVVVTIRFECDYFTEEPDPGERDLCFVLLNLYTE